MPQRALLQRLRVGRAVRVHYVRHTAYQTPATINKGNARITRDFAKPIQIRPASTAYTVMFAKVATANAPHELKSGAPGSSTGTKSKGVGHSMSCAKSKAVHIASGTPVYDSNTIDASRNTSGTPSPRAAPKRM